MANGITRSDLPDNVAYKPAPSTAAGKPSALARIIRASTRRGTS